MDGPVAVDGPLYADLIDDGDVQLVRLPKGVRLSGERALLEHDGSRLVLTSSAMGRERRVDVEAEPVRLEETRQRLAALWLEIDGLVKGDFMPDGREQPALPSGTASFD